MEYSIKILRQWYKKAGENDVKASYSVKIETLGGYMFLKAMPKSYKSLSIFALKHPELVVDVNTKETAVIVQPK